MTLESILEHIFFQKDIASSLLIASIEDDAVLLLKRSVFKNPFLESEAVQAPKNLPVNFDSKDTQLLLLIYRMRFTHLISDTFVESFDPCFSDLQLHLLRALLLSLICLVVYPCKDEVLPGLGDVHYSFPGDSEFLKRIESSITQVLRTDDNVGSNSLLDITYTTLARATDLSRALFHLLEMPPIVNSCMQLFQHEWQDVIVSFELLFAYTIYSLCMSCFMMSPTVLKSLSDACDSLFRAENSIGPIEMKWTATKKSSLLLCFKFLLKNGNFVKAVEHQVVTFLSTLLTIGQNDLVEPLVKCITIACTFSDVLRDAVLPALRKLIVHKNVELVELGISCLASMLRNSTEHFQVEITNTLLYTLGSPQMFCRRTLLSIRDVCLNDFESGSILKRCLLMLSTKIQSKLQKFFISHKNSEITFCPEECIEVTTTSGDKETVIKEEIYLLIQVSFIIECLISRSEKKLMPFPTFMCVNSDSLPTLSIYYLGLKHFLSIDGSWNPTFSKDEIDKSGFYTLKIGIAFVVLKAILSCFELGYSVNIFDGELGVTLQGFKSTVIVFVDLFCLSSMKAVLDVFVDMAAEKGLIFRGFANFEKFLSKNFGLSFDPNKYECNLSFFISLNFYQVFLFRIVSIYTFFDRHYRN